MAARRISAEQRGRLKSQAEREILRYKDDHAAWHKHIHNVDLDPAQVLKCIEMDQHCNTIDYSCRRTGKTAIKALWELKYLACNPDQELGLVAPREAQSLVGLNYHLDAVRRSEVLSAYIDYKDGRRQIADTYYRFANGSRAQAYGIMANVDGGDLTIADLEEVDDMPADRLYSRFLLMLGSNRRLGASAESVNKPIIRITGVFKGADTLNDMVESGDYHVLPVVHLYLGIEMGILDPAFMSMMKTQLSPDEYIRQLLCQNISARNLIWEKWIRQSMHIGLSANIQIAEPMPGMEHKKRGLISMGYDHTGHGENPHASKSSVVITEQIGNFTCFIFVKTWPPGTDEKIIGQDLIALWAYFRPDHAMGDAYGIGLITFVNDELYRMNLTTIDRRMIGEGQSTASTWPEWAFSPIRFEGMVKHQMATAIRSIFNNKQAVIPYLDDQDESLLDPETQDMRTLVRQLSNIKEEKSKASYASYKMVNSKLGDDCFDAAMASVWGLVQRGAAAISSIILTGNTSRDQALLGDQTIRQRILGHG